MRVACKLALTSVILILLSISNCLSAKESIIYGGGPFYQKAGTNKDSIKASGFSTVMLWTIHINSAGDLIYNDIKIIESGVYIGRSEWPAELMELKTGDTSVRRMEIAIGAWGSGAFESIKNLIGDDEEVGTDNPLYINFKALHDAIPAIDGISYDDEVTYDVASTVKFSVMLADMGFKVTLCPYTRYTYWRDVFQQTNALRPGTIDRVDLQCYAGGSYNSPSTWNGYFEGLHVTPGTWCYHSSNASEGITPYETKVKMESWNASSNIAGGFIWLYDDILNNSYPLTNYAQAINAALSINPKEVCVATMYQHCPLYKGWSADMGLGEYTTADIITAGGADNDASSISIKPGYQVTFYDEDNFQGDSITLRGDVSCLTSVNWNDMVSSMIIEPILEPVAHWNFNDGAGDILTDGAEYGFDGTLHNMDSASWETGKQCGSLYFDGIDDYVEIENYQGIVKTSTRTCSAWIKTTDSPFYIMNWGGNTARAAWSVELNDAGNLTLNFNGIQLATNNFLADGQWHHVAYMMSYEYSKFGYYVDGVLQSLIDIYPENLRTLPYSNIKLGTDISGTKFSEGYIDDIRIYSRVINEATMKAIYNECALYADFSADGRVNLKDFSSLAYNWLSSDASDFDLTCDGAVDAEDLTIMADQWLDGETDAE